MYRIRSLSAGTSGLRKRERREGMGVKSKPLAIHQYVNVRVLPADISEARNVNSKKTNMGTPFWPHASMSSNHCPSYMRYVGADAKRHEVNALLRMANPKNSGPRHDSRRPTRHKPNRALPEGYLGRKTARKADGVCLGAKSWQQPVQGSTCHQDRWREFM